MDSSHNQSEVARLRQQIALEYEAAQRGLTGLSQGTAQHAFITACMEQMGKLHEDLIVLVGREMAVQVLAETLEAAPVSNGCIGVKSRSW